MHAINVSLRLPQTSSDRRRQPERWWYSWKFYILLFAFHINFCNASQPARSSPNIASYWFLSLKAASHWAWHARCGSARWFDLSAFCWVDVQAACCKSLWLVAGWKNALIFPLYYLSLRKFSRSENPAARSGRLRAFLFHVGLSRKKGVKLRILTQKIVFHAGVCPFHHTTCQPHNSNYLKVSKISSAPQTRDPYARPSVRRPLVSQRISMVVFEVDKQRFLPSVVSEISLISSIYLFTLGTLH